ncbi:Hypothetical_protein [Hexamita inflata]|uniref:Hypothetical_protein n=1 Tax=Hexamita inflata TaxID=28002 RepID=A0AA86PLR7_9EUKA|nr:Hypothetical protein HINF_LOCUS28528 [Hexamita inflata]
MYQQEVVQLQLLISRHIQVAASYFWRRFWWQQQQLVDGLYYFSDNLHLCIYIFSGGSQQPVQLSDLSLFQSGRNQEYYAPKRRHGVCVHRSRRSCGRLLFFHESNARVSVAGLHGQAGCLADKDNSGIVSLACRRTLFVSKYMFVSDSDQIHFCENRVKVNFVSLQRIAFYISFQFFMQLANISRNRKKPNVSSCPISALFLYACSAMDVVNASDRMQSQSETVCVLSRKLRGVCSWITSQTSPLQARRNVIMCSQCATGRVAASYFWRRFWWQQQQLVDGLYYFSDNLHLCIYIFSGGSQQPVQLSDLSLFQSGRNQEYYAPKRRHGVCVHRSRRSCGRLLFFHESNACVSAAGSPWPGRMPGGQRQLGIVSLRVAGLFVSKYMSCVRFDQIFARIESKGNFVSLQRIAFYISFNFSCNLQIFQEIVRSRMHLVARFPPFSLRLFCDGCVVNASDRMQSQSETVCVLSRKLRGVCSWITSQTSSASQAQQRVMCSQCATCRVWPAATSGGDSVGSSNSWQTAVLLLGQPTTYVFTFSGGSQQPVQLSGPVSVSKRQEIRNIMLRNGGMASVFIVPDVRAAVCCSSTSPTPAFLWQASMARPDAWRIKITLEQLVSRVAGLFLFPNICSCQIRTRFIFARIESK